MHNLAFIVAALVPPPTKWALQEGMRKDLENKSRAALRAAYVSAWGMELGMRCVLAETGSHLPIFSPPCELEVCVDLCKTSDWAA